MKSIAVIIIILGAFSCALWYQHNKHTRKIRAFEQENAELRQKNKILHDIIDEKYFIVKPKQIY
jgi:hypothetical protein